MFPAPALHKETNVKKNARSYANVVIDNASNFVAIYGDTKTNAINMRINIVICNDAAIQNMDVVKSEVWTRRHLASCTLTSELAGNDIIKAILLGAEC